MSAVPGGCSECPGTANLEVQGFDCFNFWRWRKGRVSAALSRRRLVPVKELSLSVFSKARCS